MNLLRMLRTLYESVFNCWDFFHPNPIILPIVWLLNGKPFLVRKDNASVSINNSGNKFIGEMLKNIKVFTSLSLLHIEQDVSKCAPVLTLVSSITCTP